MNLDLLLRPIALRRDLHSDFRRLFDRHLPSGAVVYDIGCGLKPFKDMLAAKVSAHVGVDLADGFYEPDHVDLIGTAYEVPAPDGVADAVILSQVIEHLEMPLRAMQEAHRLLKPGGLVFLSFPFLYPVHAPPRDFLRYTEHYLSEGLASPGFEVVEHGQLGGYWYLTGMFATMYLQEVDRGRLRATRLVKLVSMVTGWFFLGMHRLEGLLLALAGKDAGRIRSRWTANHVAVLRKIG